MPAASQMLMLPKQRAYNACTDRYAAFIGGFGSAKTRALLQFITIRTFELNGERGMLGAPTGPQLEASTLDPMWEFWEDELGIKENVHYKYNRSKNIVTSLTGTKSSFFIRSYHSALRAQGPTLSWFGVDEIEGVDDQTWRVLKSRLRRKIRDPRSFHAGRLCGNPPAGDHWFLRDFYREDTKKPDHTYWTSSSLENWTLDKATLQDFEYNIYTPGSPMWRRYIGGDLEAGVEGLVYDELNPDLHFVTEAGVPWNDLQYIYGIDFGYLDPFVFLVVGRDSHGRYWILGEYYKAQKLLEEHAGVIKTMRPGVGPIYSDHGRQEREEIAKYGIATLPAWKEDRMLGVQAVKQAMNPFNCHLFIVAENCPNLVREIKGYTWAESKPEHATKEEPIDYNDHAMDAMRYAIATDMHLRGVIVTGYTGRTSKPRQDVGKIGSLVEDKPEQRQGLSEKQRERIKRQRQSEGRKRRMD